MRPTRPALALLAALALAATASATRTLLVVDDGAEADAAPLAALLRDEFGHAVDVREASEGAALHKYGEYVYENVAVLAGAAAELDATLSAEELRAFVRGGVRNVVVAASRAADLRAFANECGVDFAEGDALDYVRNAGGDPRRLLTRAAATGDRAALGAAPLEQDVEYSGPAHSFRADSELVQPVLDAEPTAVPLAHDPAAPPRLVSAVQLRHNARVVFAGAPALFASASPLGRRAVAWAFQRTGVLRVARFAHKKQDSAEFDTPGSYRIKDDVEFAIELEQADGKGGWAPFRGSDVQLEAVMLDPYVRTTLRHNGKGLYTARFRLPDVFGVYKFRVNYHRGALSYIDHTQVVSLYPFRHTDFERFLFAAYPYYTSSFSLMGGFFLFGLVFLYTK